MVLKILDGTIEKPWIKLKEMVDYEDYEMINELQEIITAESHTALKLELDYKLSINRENESLSSIQNVNEFMYFNGQQLIGYVGICNFGDALEVNGMVHPLYRQQGVFTKLTDLVIAEWRRRNSGSLLLLTDRKSNSGQQFIKKIGAQYKLSEYEMFLKDENIVVPQMSLGGITFRKANNADANEIVRQNAIYFNDENCSNTANDSETEPEKTLPTDMLILPEEEEKRGMTIYLAEKNQQIIGKVNLQLNSSIGGIYGLGVLPEHRRKGFGRAILMMAIEKLKEENASEVMLQVATENANALNLYKSCGFVTTSTMDYYEMRASG